MNFKHALALATICITGFSQILPAQSTYKLSGSKDNNMKLSGTSTRHDWVMTAHAFTGEAQFGFNPENENQLTSLESLTFSLPVLNLKSDKKKLDRNAYKALKTGLHKNIIYTFISATILPEGENEYLVRTIGNLSIAGVTKEVTMNVNCIVGKDSAITCTGSYKLKMTDYEVKPPSFMLGAMKTGDAVTLDFTMVYKKQPGI
ncbi:MAG TPA: YceI family protein [Bacteroidia bacterium]|nr:YceI family protein [Bacteroidia bacterium]